MYENRKEAAKLLSERVKKLIKDKKLDNPMIVAIPRGGIPIGVEIAKELNAPFDIFFVKKILSPDNEELAIGSVSENGLVFLNNYLTAKLGVDEDYIREKGIEKIQEIARYREKYSYDPIPVEEKDVILVDDGIATGASLYIAAQSIARDLPNSIVIASPVAPNDENVINMLKGVSHHLEILFKPDVFRSVGEWYSDFHQLSDDEVINLLNEAKEIKA